MKIKIPARSYLERQLKVNASKGDLTPILVTAGSNGDFEFINGIRTDLKVQLTREQNITLYIGFKGKSSFMNLSCLIMAYILH